MGLLMIPIGGFVVMALPRAPIPPIPGPPEARGQAENADPEPVDVDRVRRCCSALRQNAKSSPPEQKGSYLAAAELCDALAKGGVTRDAREAREALAPLGAMTPSSCKF